MKNLVRLTQERIDAIFERAGSQGDYLVGLHRAVVPDWDDVERLEGHPGCNQRLWEYVCRKAIQWDQLHCPDVMAGGAWLNYGFSTAAVADWRVTLKGCKVVRKAAGVAP